MDGYIKRMGWTKSETLVLLGKMRLQALKPNDLNLVSQVRFYVVALEHAGIFKSKTQVAFQLIRLYSKYLRLRHETMLGKKTKPWVYLNAMDKIMLIQFLHRKENRGHAPTIRRMIRRLGVRGFFNLLAARSRVRAGKARPVPTRPVARRYGVLIF